MSDPASLPVGLPEPIYDGACDHLVGMELPAIELQSHDGMPRSLRDPSSRWLVLYVYPRTGGPGVELPDGWDLISGVRGCMLAGLRGRVVEIGAGNGMNFRHYPPTTADVVAVEPEPHLRRLAGQAARDVSVPVAVLPGTADDLPLETASVDVGVVCLMLCALDDQRTGLGELHRVIRPGGELRFLEHVAAEAPTLRALQRLTDATLWPRLTGGCHTAADPVAAIQDAGFVVVEARRLRFPDSAIPVPAAPHVLGLARRP